MAGRPWRMGWLPWWVKATEAGWPWRTAAPAADGGDGGGWRRPGRTEATVADGGDEAGMEAAVVVVDVVSTVPTLLSLEI